MRPTRAAIVVTVVSAVGAIAALVASVALGQAGALASKPLTTLARLR